MKQNGWLRNYFAGRILGRLQNVFLIQIRLLVVFCRWSSTVCHVSLSVISKEKKSFCRFANPPSLSFCLCLIQARIYENLRKTISKFFFKKFMTNLIILERLLASLWREKTVRELWTKSLNWSSAILCYGRLTFGNSIVLLQRWSQVLDLVISSSWHELFFFYVGLMVSNWRSFCSRLTKRKR